jgi:hypothetical protein
MRKDHDLKVVMRASAVQALAEACPAHAAKDEFASQCAAVSRAEHGIAGAARVD